MTLELYLVRHGESTGNVNNIVSGSLPHKLTETGEAQAHLRGDSLRNEGITHIVTSPVLRARQTARIIQRYLPGLAEVENSDWTEMAFGELQGWETFDNYKRIRTRELEKDPALSVLDWKPRGGESLRELYERMGLVLAHTVEQYDHPKGLNRVLVVTHGGPMSMAMLQMQGLPLTHERYRGFLPRKNCALTRAQYDVKQGGWTVYAVNESVRKSEPVPELEQRMVVL